MLIDDLLAISRGRRFLLSLSFLSRVYLHVPQPAMSQTLKSLMFRLLLRLIRVWEGVTRRDIGETTKVQKEKAKYIEKRRRG
jgi:hypothetical protein